MPNRPLPTFTTPPDKMLEVAQPAMGGLNLHDLEYEQGITQSPDMLNVMYRNGTFGKRYGQTVVKDYPYEVHAITSFNGHTIVHVGDEVWVDETDMVADGIEDEDGVFITFGESLYYLVGASMYEYKLDEFSYLWVVLDPYVPDIAINCEPAKGGSYDRFDDMNLLTLKFNEVFNGDGTTKKYYPKLNEDDVINWDIDPIVKVNDVIKTKTTDWTIVTDSTGTYVNFTTAPADGDLNVEITFTIKYEKFYVDRERLLACRYYCAYGANGNSRLFMGGGGASKIFYSESYDATYFPENNWIIIGSTEDDVTAFGLQYNVLLVFKPHEIYSIYSYQITASMVSTADEVKIGSEAFSSNIVNSRIGCDAPHSMQLINNQLTWFNSTDGVCTLVSTSLADERNVRTISKNIDRTNNSGVKGILDYNEDLTKIRSADFNEKYFLVFPESGMCFVWDYGIVPFFVTSARATDPSTLDWYLFSNFHVKCFTQLGGELYYITSKKAQKDVSGVLQDAYPVVKLGSGTVDFDYDDLTKAVPINAHYVSPVMEFNAIEMLKTINNIYIQCRTDKPTTINISYITEENPNGEEDPEPIVIGSRLWKSMLWSNFGYNSMSFMNTYRRRCSIKKVQVMGVKFWNDDSTDMSISHLAFQYKTVKYIK